MINNYKCKKWEQIFESLVFWILNLTCGNSLQIIVPCLELLDVSWRVFFVLKINGGNSSFLKWEQFFNGYSFFLSENSFLY